MSSRRATARASARVSTTVWVPSKSQAWTPEVVEMEAPAGAAPFVATATRNSGKQARRSDLARGSTDLTMWRDRAACLEHWPLNQKCLALLVHPAQRVGVLSPCPDQNDWRSGRASCRGRSADLERSAVSAP